MTDIIIIGAGTAGLTAAIYARRAEKSVMVFEALSYGGQIINTLSIENYPAEPGISGFDYATKIYEQAKNLGAEIRFEKVIEICDDGDVKKVKTSGGEYEARAVIIATGSENRKLGVARETELIGRGISYCATCDGAFFRGKDVGVVGGGNTALEDALYLADIAKTVYLIHRRDEFRAEEALVAQIKNKPNVKLVLNSSVTELVGADKLEGIVVKNNAGETITLEVSGLFVAVGRIPENQNFNKVVNLDAAGYVIAGEDCHTSAEGIFVAGDGRTKQVRQLVTAASDGAIAATEAVKYINAKRK